MKSKLVFFLFLILLFVGFITFRFLVLDKKNNFGKIKIVSSPTASIFVNNLIVGKTPFEEKYKPGEYLLKLIPEGEATEAASWQGKIKVYKNALTYVNRELGSSDITSSGEVFTVKKMDSNPKKANTGEIYIETEPSGAIVYLDNDEKGVASMILSEVVQGQHEISVFMPGFFRRTQKVNVDSGFRVDTNFKLAIDQTKQEAEKNREKEASSSAVTSKGKSTVVIKDTPTGWLRVREEPSIEASESAKVNPGEKYDLLEQKDDWYKIAYEKGKTGWISAAYAELKTE